ncbi:MAG: hypothetical protein Q8R15_02020 [Candidatus Micrarchaeota archaeon]|nr:hypothetical protein [Candidatus Micrarchaeota archaeon]
MITQEFYYKPWYGRLYPMINAAVHSNTKTTFVDALVDSGADFCCFGNDVARLLGIEIEKGVKIELKGVTEDFAAYFHEIELQLFNKRIKCKVAFTNNPYFETNILGRLGFFETHEITFKENEKKMEIKEV